VSIPETRIENASGRGRPVRILITGGAGFVGSALARHFRSFAGETSVVVLDNLRRRGSELNLAELQARGVVFVHGDVRNPADLESLEGSFDVLIEASAEPSVLAGLEESPRYVLDTNLFGAANCLEFARKRCGGLVFLSTSRVYSIGPLRAIPLVEEPTRFELAGDASGIPGLAWTGVAEGFPCADYRSFYGASKLAAELLCQEYSAQAGLPVVINRCGVIAGPGQLGRTDQGIFTLWVARHWYGRSLRYTGFGGKGLQVRDLLHPDDLCDLVRRQIESWPVVSGKTFNVGGGRNGSVSLREFTSVCREATGREVPIAEEAATSPVDVPWYVSDNTRVTAALGWAPAHGPARIANDIAEWVRTNEKRLAGVLA